MPFSDNAVPGIALFSIQCNPLLVIATSVYIVRRRRSFGIHNVLPVHEETSFAEKVQPDGQSAEWLPPNHFDGNNWVAKIGSSHVLMFEVGSSLSS